MKENTIQTFIEHGLSAEVVCRETEDELSQIIQKISPVLFDRQVIYEIFGFALFNCSINNFKDFLNIKNKLLEFIQNRNYHAVRAIVDYVTVLTANFPKFQFGREILDNVNSVNDLKISECFEGLLCLTKQALIDLLHESIYRRDISALGCILVFCAQDIHLCRDEEDEDEEDNNFESPSVRITLPLMGSVGFFKMLEDQDYYMAKILYDFNYAHDFSNSFKFICFLLLKQDTTVISIQAKELLEKIKN